MRCAHRELKIFLKENTQEMHSLKISASLIQAFFLFGNTFERRILQKNESVLGDLTGKSHLS